MYKVSEKRRTNVNEERKRTVLNAAFNILQCLNGMTEEESRYALGTAARTALKVLQVNSSANSITETLDAALTEIEEEEKLPQPWESLGKSFRAPVTAWNGGDID